MATNNKAKANSRIPGGCTLWARKTIESDIFVSKPDKWFKIWFYIVNKVNHKDNAQFCRGQNHLSYELIMLNCNATKAEVDHCIRWLKSQRMLATRKTTRGFVVTVLNYNSYQTLDSYNYKTDNNAPVCTPKAIQKPGATSDEADSYKPEGDTKSDAKSDTEATGINKYGNKYRSNSVEFLLSELLFGEIVKRKPDFKKPNLQGWTIHTDRMIRLDKRDPARIEAVIRWCQQDDFWQNNILCTKKLRKQFDQLELKMGKSQTPRTAPLEIDENGLTPAQKFDAQLQQKERTQNYAKQPA